MSSITTGTDGELLQELGRRIQRPIRNLSDEALIAELMRRIGDVEHALYGEVYDAVMGTIGEAERTSMLGIEVCDAAEKLMKLRKRALDTTDDD